MKFKFKWPAKKETPLIEFFCHPDYHESLLRPEPASKHIPQWFKRIKPTIPESLDAMGRPGLTAKKCMPLLDAMTVGYVISLAADLGIKTNHNCSIIEITNNHIWKCAEFHNVAQIGGTKAPGYPANPIKFLNYWCVKTRPGWSTLFLPIINDMENELFSCLAGLVDTDTFPRPINFPAIWHKPNYHGVLKAGTPLVVAIPIHRDVLLQHQMPVVRKMTDAEFVYIDATTKKQESRQSVYTNELRVSRKLKGTDNVL